MLFRSSTGCGGRGWRVIGGGAAAIGTDHASWLSMSRPGDTSADADTLLDDGWEASGYGGEGPGIRSWSICLRDPGASLLWVRADLPDGPASRYGSVACPSTEWSMLAGGGLIATGASWLAVIWPSDDGDADTILDDGWSVAALDASGGTGGFYAFGICAIGAGEVTTRHGPGREGAAGAVTTVSVRCSPGTHVVGGGAWVEGVAADVRLLASAPFDGPDADRTPDDGWKVRVYRVPATPSGTSSAWATCLG